MRCGSHVFQHAASWFSFLAASLALSGGRTASGGASPAGSSSCTSVPTCPGFRRNARRRGWQDAAAREVRAARSSAAIAGRDGRMSDDDDDAKERERESERER